MISFIVVPLGGIREIILRLCQSSLRMLVIVGMNKGMQTESSPVLLIRECDWRCWVKIPSEVGLLETCFIDNLTMIYKLPFVS